MQQTLSGVKIVVKRFFGWSRCVNDIIWKYNATWQSENLHHIKNSQPPQILGFPGFSYCVGSTLIEIFLHKPYSDQLNMYKNTIRMIQFKIDFCLIICVLVLCGTGKKQNCPWPSLFFISFYGDPILFPQQNFISN